MIVTPFRRSLRAKLLLSVLVCAVLPLAAVGAWLTSTASRSGELLLHSQLDSTLSRVTASVQSSWQQRRSDILFLANNGPMRALLADPEPVDTLPAFVRRAFATMPSVSDVQVHDAAGRVRWTLGEVAPQNANGPIQSGAAAGPPLLILRATVRDESSRTAIGELEAHVRLDALSPSLGDAEAAPSAFIAVHDRAADHWVLPLTLPTEYLARGHFEWNDHRWLAVQRRMNDPQLDLIAAARLDPFLDPFSRTARIGASALALAAFVVVMLTVFVTSRLTGSLGHLAAAADRVAEGDLETHIDASSTDEVGRVGRAFNGMIDNLRRMMRQLSQREAVAAMGDLAATLAHQLRSPATAIRIDVQRTHDRLPPESTERALLARSLGQLDRLERAIAGSLKVARSAGAEFQALDVRRPLERAIANARREAAGRGLRIEEGDAEARPLIVRGDDSSLEQLFVNLLTNAAQAVEDNGTIVVTADESDSDRVSVSIRDDGPGMTADILVRAGERLFSTKPEGTGLGLVIAKRIAEAHSGVLILTSTPRSGTTARVVLPRTR